MTTEKTEKDFAGDAIFVQNACNITGVMLAFVELISWQRANHIFPIENYPPFILFKDKLQDMLGEGCDFDVYSTATRWCEENSEHFELFEPEPDQL